MTRDEPSLEITDNTEEKILSRVPLETLLCSIIAATAGFILFDSLIALLVLAGGLFSMLNFYWLKQTISKIITPGKKNHYDRLSPCILSGFY
ncbi:MAG: ATP synthase subunit I [Candidatus Aminicenantaceae bacterium]